METVTLWACLSPRELAELLKTGTHRCNEETLKAKFGAAADYCRRMYRWYTRTAGKYANLPADSLYPLWLVPEKERLLHDDKTPAFLRLEIPAEAVVRCNISAWEYRMNCLYIPSSAGDAKAHAEELALWGAGSDAELVNTHTGDFYPHLRRKIEKSWERVFTQLNVSPGILASTVWELRKEWIREIRMEVSAFGCEIPEQTTLHQMD